MPTLGYGRVGGTGGGSAFGSVPGPIGIPANLYAQTAAVVPNLDALAKQAGSFAGTELAGQLSPETIKAIQDEGAAWGVGAGMPGSGLAVNRSLRNLGLNVEQMQRQGIGDFLSTLTGIGRSMTDPALAAEIANRNSIFAAAPNPAAAAAELERQWMNRYNLTRGAGSTAPTWADLHNPGSGTITNPPGFGTGQSHFLGDAGFGGPPMVSASAQGPFDSTPNRGTSAFTLGGSTFGGSGASPLAGAPGSFYAGASQPYDDVLQEFLDPGAYYFNEPGSI